MTNDRRVSSLPLPFLVRALDCVVESVIITDAEGVVRSWNHAASLLYGFTSEEAIGRPIGELIVPVEGRDEALEAFQKIAADAGGAYTGGWDVQDRGGRRFPVVASTTVVLDPDGEPTHFIGISTDATDRREAARAVQTLANIVSSSSDAILTLDTTGVVTWANDATGLLFGWPQALLVGQHMGVLAPPEPGRRQAARFAAMLAGEPQGTTLTQCINRDGSSLDVSIAAGLIRDEDGAITGISCVIHDLTERNELRRDRDRQAVIIRESYEQASMPQAFLGMTGTVVSVNHVYRRLTGLDSDALIGQAVGSLAHRSDPARAPRRSPPCRQAPVRPRPTSGSCSTVTAMRSRCWST